MLCGDGQGTQRPSWTRRYSAFENAVSIGLLERVMTRLEVQWTRLPRFRRTGLVEGNHIAVHGLPLEASGKARRRIGDGFEDRYEVGLEIGWGTPREKAVPGISWSG
jgi:hypothetical protein